MIHELEMTFLAGANEMTTERRKGGSSIDLGEGTGE